MCVLYMKESSLFLAMRSILSKRKNALSFFTRWTLKEPSRTSSPNPLRSGPVQFSNRLSISYSNVIFAFIHVCKTRSVYFKTTCSFENKVYCDVTCSLTACSCFLFMSLMYQATAVMVMMASSTTSYPGSLLSKCLDSSYHKRETPNHQKCQECFLQCFHYR